MGGMQVGLDKQYSALVLTSSKYFQSEAVPGRRNSVSKPAQSSARFLQA